MTFAHVYNEIEASLAQHTSPKLKPTCPRKTKNSWSLWSQSGGWKGRKTMEERICGKDEF